MSSATILDYTSAVIGGVVVLTLIYIVGIFCAGTPRSRYKPLDSGQHDMWPYDLDNRPRNKPARDARGRFISGGK